MTLKTFKKAKKAEVTNMIEEAGKPLTVKSGGVKLPVGHHTIETVKMGV